MKRMIILGSLLAMLAAGCSTAKYNDGTGAAVQLVHVTDQITCVVFKDGYAGGIDCSF